MNSAQENIIHKKMMAAWATHKARTGMSQLKGAQAMGMGQSAFSQYLRGKEKGGIPPNHAFVVKFAKLVGLSPTDLGWEDSDVVLKSQFIHIRFKFSGERVPNKKIPVDSAVVNDATFAIESDGTGPQLLCSSEYLLADEKQKVREGDVVWSLRENNEKKQAIYGRLVAGKDWRIVSLFDGTSCTSTKVEKNDRIYRIVGSFIPQKETKVFM